MSSSGTSSLLPDSIIASQQGGLGQRQQQQLQPQFMTGDLEAAAPDNLQMSDVQ